MQMHVTKAHLDGENLQKIGDIQAETGLMERKIKEN